MKRKKTESKKDKGLDDNQEDSEFKKIVNWDIVNMSQP